jgi:autotransporter-associated beta strand protein/T5SS/PEP-CTERM-associated repeat protein
MLAPGAAIAGPGWDHTNITGTLLSRLAPGSEGTIALTRDSSENFDFGALGFNTLFLGAGSNVTYTGSFTPAFGAYRFGGGGGALVLPNPNMISGNNALYVSGAGGGTVELTAANDYSGGTVVQTGGTLIISNANQVGTGLINLNTGSLRFTGGSPITLPQTISVEVGGGALDVRAPSVTLTGGLSGAGADATAFNKIGPGSLILSGGSSNMGSKTFLVRDGSLQLQNGATFSNTDVNTAFLSIGAGGTERASLTISDSTMNVGEALNIGDVGASQGTLLIQGNSTVTARGVFLGKNGTSQGAGRQTGGSVTSAAAPIDWRLGGNNSNANDANAVGTYTMTGGTFSTAGNLHIGARGKGALTVLGGTAGAGGTTPGGPSIGRFTPSYGVLTVENTGRFEQTTPQNQLVVGEQGQGFLNVENGGTVLSNGGMRLGFAANGRGVVNLRPGGTIVTANVAGVPGIASALGQFNFHGGTLKPLASTTGFMDNVSQALIWQGGAVIDTDGKDVTVRQNFSAPTGQGVTDIPLTAGGSGYIANPVVELTGGGGTGAAAVAILDAAGSVTGIRVTNPGIGYTSAPTVNLRGGGAATPATVGAPALGANVGGGLTKIGAGTLTLGGRSTYTGPTAINAGTLKLGEPTPVGLTHRYSFGTNAANVVEDSVGTAHGQLVNGATLANGRVVLANPGNSTDVTTGDYVDLPNNIARTSSLTIEGWANWNANNVWQRLFDFGHNNLGEQQPGSTATGYFGVSTTYLTPRSGNDPGQGRLTNLGVEMRLNPTSRFVNARSGTNAIAFPVSPESHHFAVTRDAATDTLTLYLDGQPVGVNAAALEDPAMIEMLNMWLGRSNWQGDPFFAGSFDEFRIYDGALTPEAVLANFTAGPDATPGSTFSTVPQADYLPVTTAMSIAPGATFDLANLNSRIGSLSGPAGSTVQLGTGTLSVGGDNTSTSFSGNLNGTGGLTKEGTGTFTLPTAQPYTGATAVTGGTLRVTGSIANSSGVTASTAGNFEAVGNQTVKGLTVNPGGKATISRAAGATTPAVLTTPVLALAGGQVDVVDNAMIVDYAAGGPSPVANIRSALASGKDGGSWNGMGIVSSVAAANPSRGVGYAEAMDLLGAGGGTFLGQPADASSILIRHTLNGDANLNGEVNFTDLVALAQNYGTATGDMPWNRGDFTYDGNVTFLDLVALAQNYGSTLPTTAQIAELRAGAGFEQDLAAAFAQVPEPGSLALLGIAATAMMGRRRRRRS